MLSYQKIGKYLTAEPFRPFRIQLSSGRTFEIRHPEMVAVGKTTMIIYTYMSDDPQEAKERQVEVSLLLTESMELVDANPQSQNM
jgi:hypothetical protein